MACKSLPRFLVTFAFCFVGLVGVGIPASAAVHDRIFAPAARTSYVAIPDSVHPRVKLANDMGPTPADTRLQGMTIRFNMTDGQQAALDQLLADQQDPLSSRYRQWLTPAQYADEFGMSSADLAQISAWLSSQGFTVTGIANSRTFITFDGTVAVAQAAFATSIHNLSLKGETHFANVTNVSIPGAFAGVVSVVTGLHNFRLKARVHSNVTSPHFTSSVSGSHYIAPGDLYTIYQVNPLLNAGINGTGQTIAVMGQVDINSADIAAFRSASGLSTSNLPTTVLAGADPGPPTCTSCTTAPSQGDLTESSIDLEWAGAMAPSASILFVNGKDVFSNSMTYAIDSNLAPIVTTSYGLCEAGWGTTEMLTMNGLFKQGNAQGQTILAASADSGATDCDAGPSATQGLAVDFPGSSPYVTSMGGTMFNGDAAAVGSGTTWAATQYWTGTSGSDALSSAKGYIPETVWNDSSIGQFGGGGGGASAFFTKPAWQVGTPADAARDVPDISLTASPSHDSLLFCVNVATGVSCGSGFRTSATNNGLDAEGGTSFDSQIFGGLLALIEQKVSPKGLGNINPTLYALGNNAAYYAPGQTILDNPNLVFNDVTTGNNAMACTGPTTPNPAGTPNCGNGGTAGYSAVLGYDLATGWGSVNVANLATNWNAVPPLGIGTSAPNTSVTTLATTPVAPVSLTLGATATLTATVTGTAGSPTGTVTFLANNVALGTPVALPASGIATYTWVTGCSALGQQVITAAYSGDANYQGSIGPVLTANGSNTTSRVEVVVNNTTCPDFAISPVTPAVTVAAGGTIPGVAMSATPTNNFTGTVVFSATVTSASGYTPTVTFSPASVAINSSAAVTTTLTLSGITADLRLPKAPGRVDSGTMLARHDVGQTRWYAAGSGVTIASLLLLMLPRRRGLGGLLLVALAIALVGGVTGCGSGSQSVAAPNPPSGGSTTLNPYVGTYVVTVVAISTNSSKQVTQHSAVVTYTIN